MSRSYASSALSKSMLEFARLGGSLRANRHCCGVLELFPLPTCLGIPDNVGNNLIATGLGDASFQWRLVLSVNQ